MRTTTVLQRLFIPAASIAAFLIPSAASAATFTFNFAVDVTSVTGVALTEFPTLGAGDIITGQFSFDDTTIDSQPNVQFGQFNFVTPGSAAASLTIEGKTVSWTGTRIDTFNGGIDFYRFQNFGPSIDDPQIPLATFLGQIIGTSSLLAGTALPTTPPDPAFFTSSSFSIFIETQAGDGNIDGTIRSLTASPVTTVPEPASMVLLGSGLAAALARRKRT